MSWGLGRFQEVCDYITMGSVQFLEWFECCIMHRLGLVLERLWIMFHGLGLVLGVVVNILPCFG